MLGNILPLCYLGITRFDVVACPCLRLEIPGVGLRRYRSKGWRASCCGRRRGGDNRGEWVDCCGGLGHWSGITTVLLRERHEVGNVKREGVRHTTKE